MDCKESDFSFEGMTVILSLLDSGFKGYHDITELNRTCFGVNFDSAVLACERE